MAVYPGSAAAATLPPHRPLRILVVSDTVNPHGLSSPNLTEGLYPGPGDIGHTLRLTGTGIDTGPGSDAVREVPTNDIEIATTHLSVPPCDVAAYDVVIYFAHRIPLPDAMKPAPQVRQDAFTAAVDAFLTTGGGLVAFHHGSYTAAGKSGILDLIGATASGAVPWDTVNGQNVINTASGHFVTTNGLTYPLTVAYADPARGVPADVYPYFNNVPDERYPNFAINPTAGFLQTIFGSTYVDNGTTHLLGFTHRRSTWSGTVVGYQPGEYQPNALDDLAGRNFQILANAILYAADARQRNSLALAVSKGPGADDVELSWSAGQGSYTVYRSNDPRDVTSRCRRLGATVGQNWNDAPPAAPVTFYQVAGP